ncbi:hypothetical protein AAAV04_03495 [Phascolarctobacterium faecium]|mgnify:FL=1|jgi:hypothetical protein|uniref:hypothetical protein n=1 Tax=Phascolarctobacterium faecium TaxID=33025 RepID=UPI002670BB7C|nr:hypothetical protein [Phascolarctobacterium faecium]
MNKIFKLILVLSLLVFSAVSISGCSSEKEKIAKEYTGVWRADKKTSSSNTQYYLVIKPSKTNENTLDIRCRIISKSNPDFYGATSKINFAPKITLDEDQNAIINEQTKIANMTHMFKEPLIISTEGDTKFIKYNAMKFIKTSNDPKIPELKDIKF